DLLGIQTTNLQNLPKNYLMKFWIYHAMTWLQISFIMEDHKGHMVCIVGYVVTKMWHSLTLSLMDPTLTCSPVMRSRRMCPPKEVMVTIYKVSFMSLHVRESNKATITLYCTLSFRVAKVEDKYSECIQI
ncbi:hypothetical protein DFH08DRAFT_713268, partial [Mycena albidolilacea]